MYYASFSALALILHILIHKEALLKKGDGASASSIWYRQFLISVLVYYITDILWGFLYELHLTSLVYADTMIYFLSMVASVLLWTHYVVAYLGREGLFPKFIRYMGWFIFGFEILNLIINFFYPALFYFTAEKTYVPGVGRYITLGFQVILYLATSVYTLFIAANSKGSERSHNLAVGFSGLIMILFIVLQTFNPLLPYYAIGCLIGTGVVHTFVEQDEKQEKELYNNIAASLAKDYEAIYYIDIETGRYGEFSTSREYESMNVPMTGEDFYTETQENAARYAHPDDREFAQSLYTRDSMKKHLEGKTSYSYKYRIMVNGEARYFRFTVMLADDKKHFVLYEKNIHDEITAETAALESQKNHITFGQIAESLALNYDAVYYVDANDSSYISYATNDLYGLLEVRNEGDDYFAESRKYLEQLAHPDDRERVLSKLDKDYFLTKLEDLRQYTIDHRIILNGKDQYTRLNVRKTSDSSHFIISVENIDDEVRKEKEHILALNSEKELARRDELTGTKNKTAYTELERSVQANIDNGLDYLPFAIVVCDTNNLKKINDTKGHKAGDKYIKASAMLLCRIFSHSPVFRIGGDEFVVFLRGDDYSSRERLIRELYDQVQENLSKKEGPIIAAGMSEYNPETDTKVSDIFERADNLMYENKRFIKNGI